MRRMNVVSFSPKSSATSESASDSHSSSIPSELSEVHEAPRPKKVTRVSQKESNNVGRKPRCSGKESMNEEPVQRLSVPDTTTEVASLRAQIAQMQQDRDRIIEQKVKERELDIRRDAALELGRSEAGWRERVRNERLVRLSYERVLMSLGFAPSRIASDIVRVSRPQPLNEDPSLYGTLNLANIEAGLVAPPSRQRGLFSYTMEELRSGASSKPPVVEKSLDEKIESLSKEEEFFLLKPSAGKKELLRTLSSAS